MTFAFAMVTRRIAFVAADRMYSGVGSLNGFAATKIFSLKTSDGDGFITYAGAGARSGSKPFEVSEWLERVLRGANRTLEESLQEIAIAAEEQDLDVHGPGHTFGYAGFIDTKPRLALITSQDEFRIRNRDGSSSLPSLVGQTRFRVMNFNLGERVSRFGLALGSGARHFPPDSVMEMISRQSAKARADHLAAQRLSAWFVRTNREISAKEPATVGPEALCAWQYAGGGGAHAAYDERGQRCSNTGLLPIVSNGFPLTKLLEPMWQQIQSRMATWQLGAPSPGDLPPEPTQAEMEDLNKAVQAIDTAPRRKF